MNFTFLPQWKEELVCSSSLGDLTLEMPMGVLSVYLPTKATWQDSAPTIWARPQWYLIYAQLKAWCALQDIPLFVDDTASVFISKKESQSNIAFRRACMLDSMKITPVAYNISP